MKLKPNQVILFRPLTNRHCLAHGKYARMHERKAIQVTVPGLEYLDTVAHKDVIGGYAYDPVFGAWSVSDYSTGLRLGGGESMRVAIINTMIDLETHKREEIESKLSAFLTALKKQGDVPYIPQLELASKRAKAKADKAAKRVLDV
jgi:hypothetical protein